MFTPESKDKTDINVEMAEWLTLTVLLFTLTGAVKIICTNLEYFGVDCLFAFILESDKLNGHVRWKSGNLALKTVRRRRNGADEYHRGSRKHTRVVIIVTM